MGGQLIDLFQSIDPIRSALKGSAAFTARPARQQPASRPFPAQIFQDRGWPQPRGATPVRCGNCERTVSLQQCVVAGALLIVIRHARTIFR